MAIDVCARKFKFLSMSTRVDDGRARPWFEFVLASSLQASHRTMSVLVSEICWGMSAKSYFAAPLGPRVHNSDCKNKHTMLHAAHLCPILVQN